MPRNVSFLFFFKSELKSDIYDYSSSGYWKQIFTAFLVQKMKVVTSRTKISSLFERHMSCKKGKITNFYLTLGFKFCLYF